MPTHDFVCAGCGTEFPDLFIPLAVYEEADLRHAPPCCSPLTIQWRARSRDAQWDGREAIAVWEHPQTGEVRYPARNDVEMPKRYAEQGFVRRELRSLSAVDSFCRSKGVLNERRDFDSGSGRSHDGNDQMPVPQRPKTRIPSD